MSTSRQRGRPRQLSAGSHTRTLKFKAIDSNGDFCRYGRLSISAYDLDVRFGRAAKKCFR